MLLSTALELVDRRRPGGAAPQAQATCCRCDGKDASGVPQLVPGRRGGGAGAKHCGTAGWSPPQPPC